MTPDTIRTFVALFLPEEVLDAIAAAVRDAPALPRDVRWTTRHNVHLTLRFLGNIGHSRVDDVTRAIHAAARGCGALTLRAGAPGAFPHLKAPRVVWIGLDGDVRALVDLASRIESQLVDAGFGPADKPFAPHLTIGRVRPPVPRIDWAEALRGLRVDAPSFTLREACVVQSQLHPRGSIYTPLARIPLGDA